MTSLTSSRSKRKRPQNDPLDLANKISGAVEGGFGLEVQDFDGETTLPSVGDGTGSGLYGLGNRTNPSLAASSYRSSRYFHSTPSHGKSANQVSSIGRNKDAESTAPSKYSFARSLVTQRSRAKSSKSNYSSSRTARLPLPAVHIVCAIGENLARETCVASLDAGAPISLQVTKQANGQNYAETLAYLQILKPNEILLNEGRKNSPLSWKIAQFYNRTENLETNQAVSPEDPSLRNGDASGGNTVIKYISRACFDQTKGAALLRRLARPDTYDTTLIEEYILLSSSHAVLNYIQHTLGTSFSRQCLDVIVNSGGKNRMAIDRATLLQLELLSNARTGRAKDSLISSVDCTKTTVGTRLLRSTLMAPPSRADTITSRLDLVDICLESEDFFYDIFKHLSDLPPVDKMLTNIAVIPKLQTIASSSKRKPVVSAKLASKGISALLCVKTTLTALPSLADTLRDKLVELEGERLHRDDEVTATTTRSSLLVGLGAGPTLGSQPHQHHLLRAILETLSQPQLLQLRDTISNIFTKASTFSKNSHTMRHQECFALKSEDGLMDVLRQTFLWNVDEIHRKADEYAEIHGLRVAVRHSVSRGYFLAIPRNIPFNLPSIFIHPTISGQYTFCTTEEVLSLNSRARDNVQDLLFMTYQQIQEVLDEARSMYESLAAVSDAIAILDLCHGFADKVTLSKLPWCRPTVFDPNNCEKHRSVGMKIRNGRYSIEVPGFYGGSTDHAANIVPNDTDVASHQKFTVVSGINGSGKSTYLKQIAIIALLAHCGSYVPAEEAIIPLRNRLFARMGTEDDQENNISSFMLEMKETAFICSNASKGALILLDELGRATSNEDGVSIAWAIAEYLVETGGLTFFVTHYPQLCHFTEVYPSSAQNQHLGAIISDDSGGDRQPIIRYTHKVKSGACSAAPNYGVRMALSCGWPPDLVEEAVEIESGLREYLNSREGEQSQAENDGDLPTPEAQEDCPLIKTAQSLKKIVSMTTSVASIVSELQMLKETSDDLISRLPEYHRISKGRISTKREGHDWPYATPNSPLRDPEDQVCSIARSNKLEDDGNSANGDSAVSSLSSMEG